MRLAIAIAALFPCIAMADSGTDLFREVLGTAQICAYGKGPTDRQDCFVKAAPERCEREARSGTRFHTLFFSQFKACVISCGNAGAWSSTVGDCSRSLVIDHAGEKYAALWEKGCFSSPSFLTDLECQQAIEDQ